MLGLSKAPMKWSWRKRMIAVIALVLAGYIVAQAIDIRFDIAGCTEVVRNGD